MWGHLKIREPVLFLRYPGDCSDCSANGEVIRWRECGKRFIEEEQRVSVGIKGTFILKGKWGEEKSRQGQL